MGGTSRGSSREDNRQKKNDVGGGGEVGSAGRVREVG